MSSKSKKSGQQPESVQFANEDGSAIFSLYENSEYEIEVIRPADGQAISKAMIRPDSKHRTFSISLEEGLPAQVDTVELLSLWIRELVTKKADSDLQTRLEWKNGTEKSDPKTLRWVAGGRLEELVFRVLRVFKGTVFDDVVWNGKTGEWGLPTPAQKISEQTGKKLPDIMAFQGNNVYVVETTLLRGRAQWNQEAASVPDHIEDARKTYRDKSVSGVFIAPKIEAKTQTILVTVGRDNDYRVVPLEVEEFLKIVVSIETGGKDAWEHNLATLWSVLKRSAVQAKP
ncbi:MAG TPA: AlwI family type II restriction endonuclease [Candidatus Bathyarchaeia archaeon]|nr:AlwI family type II restriction endonuclease [Candidatus Bathyarchaeia archaeon]